MAAGYDTLTWYTPRKDLQEDQQHAMQMLPQLMLRKRPLRPWAYYIFAIFWVTAIVNTLIAMGAALAAREWSSNVGLPTAI